MWPDVDALIQSIAKGDEREEFDMNHDGQFDSADLGYWVHELKNTFFGDADLDGQFDSGDIAMVFRFGEYEDGIPLNSTWAEGDWNLDLDFNSSDLVAAFRDGGYEQGPRPARAVPEPAGLTLLLIGLLMCRRRLSLPDA